MPYQIAKLLVPSAGGLPRTTASALHPVLRPFSPLAAPIPEKGIGVVAVSPTVPRETTGYNPNLAREIPKHTANYSKHTAAWAKAWSPWYLRRTSAVLMA